MKINEFGFDSSSCNSCKYDKEESDELVDGVPHCLKEGYCKHLKNVKMIIKKEGLDGNPMNFYKAGCLERFEAITEQIIALSPYDGMKLPTISFYPHMEGEVDHGAVDFIQLLSLKISYIRNSMLDQRMKEAKRHGSGI